MDTRKALANYATEERPWGSFVRFTLNEPSTVKILTLLPGKKFSLQKHSGRDEFWRIMSGSGTLVIGDETKEAKVGDEFYASRGTAHRAQAGSEGMQLLEISFGEFDEHDEVRLEDDFGRT